MSVSGEQFSQLGRNGRVDHGSRRFLALIVYYGLTRYSECLTYYRHKGFLAKSTATNRLDAYKIVQSEFTTLGVLAHANQFYNRDEERRQYENDLGKWSNYMEHHIKPFAIPDRLWALFQETEASFHDDPPTETEAPK